MSEGLILKPLAATLASALGLPRQLVDDTARHLRVAGMLPDADAPTTVENAVTLLLGLMAVPTPADAPALARFPLLFSKGEVREQIRAGGAERDIALGRIAFGSGIMTLIASYAASGLITGAGPDDPGEKAVLRTTGWQPYSFKIGDEYYSYFYYEPLGSLFGIAADFSEIRARYPEIAREEEWDRLAAMIVGSMTNNLTNKTYLRGLWSATA